MKIEMQNCCSCLEFCIFSFFLQRKSKTWSNHIYSARENASLLRLPENQKCIFIQQLIKTRAATKPLFLPGIIFVGHSARSSPGAEKLLQDAAGRAEAQQSQPKAAGTGTAGGTREDVLLLHTHNCVVAHCAFSNIYISHYTVILQPLHLCLSYVRQKNKG